MPKLALMYMDITKARPIRHQTLLLSIDWHQKGHGYKIFCNVLVKKYLTWAETQNRQYNSGGQHLWRFPSKQYDKPATGLSRPLKPVKTPNGSHCGAFGTWLCPGAHHRLVTDLTETDRGGEPASAFNTCRFLSSPCAACVRLIADNSIKAISISVRCKMERWFIFLPTHITNYSRKTCGQLA